MKPPICRICLKRFDPQKEGGLVYFKKIASDLEWDEKMKKPGMTCDSRPMQIGSAESITKKQKN